MALRTPASDHETSITIIIMLVALLLCAGMIVMWSLELIQAERAAVLPKHTTHATHATQQQDALESINIRIQFTPVHQSSVRHRAVSSLDLGPSSATIAVNAVPKAPRYAKKD